MSVTSNRSISVNMEGDVNAPNLIYTAAENASAPGVIENKALSSGVNTITVPSGARAVTIVPPLSNTVTLTLKGVTGDTGVGMSLVDPTSLALSTTQSTFVITTNGTVTVRLIWS